MLSFVATCIGCCGGGRCCLCPASDSLGGPCAPRPLCLASCRLATMVTLSAASETLASEHLRRWTGGSECGQLVMWISQQRVVCDVT